jgi:hypothetical protein
MNGRNVFPSKKSGSCFWFHLDWPLNGCRIVFSISLSELQSTILSLYEGEKQFSNSEGVHIARSVHTCFFHHFSFPSLIKGRKEEEEEEEEEEEKFLLIRSLLSDFRYAP